MICAHEYFELLRNIGDIGRGRFLRLHKGNRTQTRKLQRKVISQYTYNVACMVRYPDHTENVIREKGLLTHFRYAEGRLLWSSIWHSGQFRKTIIELVLVTPLAQGLICIKSGLGYAVILVRLLLNFGSHSRRTLKIMLLLTFPIQCILCRTTNWPPTILHPLFQLFSTFQTQQMFILTACILAVW